MLLEVVDISSYYGPVCALKDASIKVDYGEIVAVIGRNGAGKSTLLKTISGLVKPLKGTITFNGDPIIGIDANEIVSLGISHVPEGRQVFGSLNVFDNLMAGAYIRNDKKEIKKDIELFCEMFPVLGERMNQPAGYLSGGEQQMLTIARALMSRPKLLLMDEPSLGLAPSVVSAVYNIISEIRQENMAILLVEQNANRALSISDRGYVLNNGVIELSGLCCDLEKNKVVQDIYMGASNDC